MNVVDYFGTPALARLAIALAHFMWQGLIIALLALGTARLFAKNSSRARYLIYLTSLFVMLLCLGATYCFGQAPNMAKPETTTSETTKMPVVSPPIAKASGSENLAAVPETSPHSKTKTTPQISKKAQPGTEQKYHRFIDWQRYIPYVTGLYSLGVLIMLGRLVIGMLAGLRLRSASEPVTDPKILSAIPKQVQALGLAFTPAIEYCRRIAVPTVVGLLKPTILLPLSFASGLTREQIEMLLAHELAHIRRYDPLFNIMQRIIEAILFFHPAVWLISGKVRMERENCCDDIVVKKGAKVSKYASSLLEIAQRSLSATSSQRKMAEQLSATGKSSRLGDRIRRLMEQDTEQKIRLRHGSIGGILLLTMLVLIMATEFKAAVIARTDRKTIVPTQEKEHVNTLNSIPDTLGENLLLYYPFKQDNGTQATDISGKGRHGRVHGAKHTIDEHRGGAMSFDGHDDYISIPNLELRQHSFAAWVKTSQTGGALNNKRIFMLDTGNNFHSLEGNSRGGLSIYGTRSAEVNEYNWQFASNVWVHIAVTFDDSAVKIYINGKPLIARWGIPNIAGALKGEVRIGGNASHRGGFWQGSIDEVALFNRALSETEVRQLYNMSQGHGEVPVQPPVTPRPEPTEYAPMPGKTDSILYYSFDTDEGQKVTDRSGHGYNGSVQGARFEANGKKGGAMSFDGQDDYISVPDVRADNFSFSAWVKTSTSGGGVNNRRIFTLDDGLHCYALQGNIGGALSIVSDGQEINEYNWQFEANAWVHLTLTHEKGNFRLYKNGELTEVGTLASNLVAGTFCIGGNTSHRGGFWRGMIDEVVLFNRALDETEVRELFGMTARVEETVVEPITQPKPRPQVLPPPVPSEYQPASGKTDSILYYSFDTDEGQKATDRSGHGYNGSVQGARFEADGKKGGAMSFDGQDDYVSVRDVKLEKFTFSAWVKSSASGSGVNNRRIFTLDDGMHYYALQGNFRGGLSIVSDGQEINTFGWQFETNSWTHLTLTHEKGNFRLYKNGALTRSGLLSSNPVSGTLCIGGTGRHRGGFWRGMIDEVVLFNRALDETEVRQLYDNQLYKTIGRPRPEATGALERFAGLWSGMAVDKPEDGTSRDHFKLNLKVDEKGQLLGQAFGAFVKNGYCELEALKVAGNQISFKVIHRTSLSMAITLELRNDKLKGEGVPIGGDKKSDRCDINLERKSANSGVHVTTDVKKKVVETSNYHRNLVLYYSFEQEDKKQVIDVSGNHNNGSIHGARYAEDRAGGKGMAFDGQDNYLSIPGIHLQRFTFSAVVKPQTTTGSLNNQRLFLLDGDKGYYTLQGNTSGTLEFRASIHGRWAGIDENNNQPQLEDWHSIAVTCDGFTVKIYRNGILTGQGRIFGDDVAGTAYIGGTDAHNGRFWNGMIDEVALFNKALTSQEIKDLHRTTAEGALPQYLSASQQEEFSDELMAVKVPEMSDDVVLHYSFDKDFGDEILDNSGRGHHAHAYGTKHVSDGRSGGALSFNGQDDYLSVDDIHLDNFTFSAFVKTLLPANKPNTNNRRLFLLYDGPHYYALQGNSRGSIGLDVTGHRGVDEYNWGFEPHIWTHIAVTYDRPTVKIYKDGKLTQLGQLDVQPVTGTLYIGGTEKHWGRYWHGLIDEVTIYNKALTQQDIEQLYRIAGEPPYKAKLGHGIFHGG